MEHRRSEAARGRRRGRSLELRGDQALLAVAIDDAAARQVVRRQLHADAVARREPDEVAAHAASRVGDQLVAALDLDLEHRIGQRLGDDGVHDNRRFLLAAVILVGFGRFRRSSRTSTLTLELSQDSSVYLEAADDFSRASIAATTSGFARPTAAKRCSASTHRGFFRTASAISAHPPSRSPAVAIVTPAMNRSSTISGAIASASRSLAIAPATSPFSSRASASPAVM